MLLLSPTPVLPCCCGISTSCVLLCHREKVLSFFRNFACSYLFLKLLNQRSFLQPAPFLCLFSDVSLDQIPFCIIPQMAEESHDIFASSRRTAQGFLHQQLFPCLEHWIACSEFDETFLFYQFWGGEFNEIQEM